MKPANLTALLKKKKSIPILQMGKKKIEVGKTSSNVSTCPIVKMLANLQYWVAVLKIQWEEGGGGYRGHKW